MIVYELIVKEDLDVGIGKVTRTNPGGGQMQGSQINIASLAFASVSQAWAPGTLGIGVTATTSISVKGVLPGDFFLISLSTQPPGAAMDLYAVVGTDSVTVYLGNGSGVSQAVAAGTLKLSVFKTP